MANLITYREGVNVPPLQMSNGLTSVFVSVLSLAASALAETDHQRELAVWIASRDQAVYGLGLVGFDLADLPWSKSKFAEDQAFLLRVIEAAKAKVGWEHLDYSPNEAWLFDCLDYFAEMVRAFSVEHALVEEERIWPFGGKPESFRLCTKHHVYLHNMGCVLCNGG